MFVSHKKHKTLKIHNINTPPSRSEGRPSRGISSPGGGADQGIRCFRVVVLSLSLSSSSDLKNTKIQKQHFRLISDSYERTRRAVRCKRIVRTRRVFFVKMSNLTKLTFYGPGLWPGPMGPAHGPNLDPWAQSGPMGPGPKWAHFRLFPTKFRYSPLNPAISQ